MSKAEALALTQWLATSSPQPDDWPGISRATLAAELTARLLNPDLIRQADTSMCGPASFMRAVASDMPLNYARCAIDLYKSGVGNIVGLDIAPRRRLRRSPPKMGTDAADWIMMCSLRDEENLVLSGAQSPGFVAGMTLPRAMVKWFKRAGYPDVSDQARIGWWPLEHRLATARYASNLHVGGYRVVMLIDADILYGHTRFVDKINVPNHWVTLTSPIFRKADAKVEEPVSFEVYSWGGRVLVPDTSTSVLQACVPLRLFLQKFYGFVGARL